jgi:hypothetical protein
VGAALAAMRCKVQSASIGAQSAPYGTGQHQQITIKETKSRSFHSWLLKSCLAPSDEAPTLRQAALWERL